jgi:hypothetical protein
MRLYFRVVSDFAEIPDTDGLGVRDTSEVRSQILKALEAIRKEKPHLFEEGGGWRVDVADDSGQVLFSVPLVELAEGTG